MLLPVPLGLKITHWLGPDEFIGTVTRRRRYNDTPTPVACYGWSKGAGFFIYTIREGHIEKIGTIARTDIDEARIPSA